VLARAALFAGDASTRVPVPAGVLFMGVSGCGKSMAAKMENSFGYSELRGGGNNPNIFSSFLTWMQGKPPGVFVVPTANRIEKLPVEVIRKRRCDRLFFPDLPRPMPSASAFWTSICGRTTPIRQPSTLLRCRP
jgi:SpoVK/Ycf46/Vps4 family AAA+-type ATPase